MKNSNFEIIKSSGKTVSFSYSKLRNSLLRSGADKEIVKDIINQMRDELYNGISTNEIYNRAFALLKKSKSVYASKYKLKKAIYELGPSGFPFEKFIGELLKKEGYEVKLNQILSGHCVNHEVDLVVKKNSKKHLIECKFHSEEGRKCDVKIPLYIYSRFQDIYNAPKNSDTNEEGVGWVVTNTSFSEDAVNYGNCKGLYLLSWNYPEKNSLKSRVDNSGLYPITVSTLLSEKEKQFLLNRDIILGEQLLRKEYLLDHQGISENRKKKILAEFKILCSKNP